MLPAVSVKFESNAQTSQGADVLSLVVSDAIEGVMISSCDSACRSFLMLSQGGVLTASVDVEGMGALLELRTIEPVTSVL